MSWFVSWNTLDHAYQDMPPREDRISQTFSRTKVLFIRTQWVLWDKWKWNKESGPVPRSLSPLPTTAFQTIPAGSRTPSEVWDSWGIWTITLCWCSWERDHSECGLHYPQGHSPKETGKSNLNIVILLYSTSSTAAPSLNRRRDKNPNSYIKHTGSAPYFCLHFHLPFHPASCSIIQKYKTASFPFPNCIPACTCDSLCLE